MPCTHALSGPYFPSTIYIYFFFMCSLRFISFLFGFTHLIAFRGVHDFIHQTPGREPKRRVYIYVVKVLLRY